MQQFKYIIEFFDLQNRVLSFCLSDIFGKDDIYINDVLIEEGYVQFVADNLDLVYVEDL